MNEAEVSMMLKLESCNEGIAINSQWENNFILENEALLITLLGLKISMQN